MAVEKCEFLLLHPTRGAEYCNMLVCMSVILSACISQKNVQTSQNFLYILPVAMAHISCNDSEICHVLVQSCG